jgi:steroid 5-alpha reductase family enzyme
MDHKKEKACIDHGLWKYTRHPNYLGELTFWVGIYIMYFSHVNAINFNLVYPLLMIALFLFISIPLMEKKLVHRPGYQEYKAQVSMLIPFRKKRSR